MNCELMLTYDTPALRQTGSRNLTDQKTLPTIWGTYMKLVTKYQISAMGGILFYLCPSFRPSRIFFITFFSVTVDGRNLIFGHKHHIGIPYCGWCFWTRQIPTSCYRIHHLFLNCPLNCGLLRLHLEKGWKNLACEIILVQNCNEGWISYSIS
jgi:hypothetical protein